MKKHCEEQIRVEDVGDEYSGYETCGGNIEPIGKTGLAQCDHCKKVLEVK